MWFWRHINTISCARNKLKRLNGKTPISSAKRENQRKIHFNRSLLLPWQPNDCHIFCQVLSIVGFSNISNTLTIMVLYPFCCPNRIHQYFRLFLSFLEMTIPSLSQPFCTYIHKQTLFAARVGWLNSQKSVVMFLIVCTSTPRIQFHLIGLATAEGSGGNHVAWWLIGWALETGNWVWILTLPLTSWVTLGKSFHLRVSLFSSIKYGHNGTWFIVRLQWSLKNYYKRLLIF